LSDVEYLKDEVEEASESACDRKAAEPGDKLLCERLNFKVSQADDFSELVLKVREADVN